MDRERAVPDRTMEVCTGQAPLTSFDFPVHDCLRWSSRVANADRVQIQPQPVWPGPSVRHAGVHGAVVNRMGLAFAEGNRSTLSSTTSLLGLFARCACTESAVSSRLELRWTVWFGVVFVFPCVCAPHWSPYRWLESLDGVSLSGTYACAGDGDSRISTSSEPAGGRTGKQ